ncbi:MAG: hypothetical protein AB7V58_10925 [Solirubrobacterales bacterium]
MRRRHALQIAVAAVLGALAILALPALASAKDRNHDHISDRWEKRHKLSLQVNQAHRDQDGDGLENLGEFRAGDNPRDDDSDDDGVSDGEENAGTISAFDPASGKLTIALFGGESITGLVSSETEIKCEGPDGGASASSDGGGEEAGDDHGGQGEEEPGDDHGGEGGEDDHGGDSGPGGGDQQQGASCSTGDLAVGAVVQQAELELRNGVATFHEVELAPTS